MDTKSNEKLIIGVIGGKGAMGKLFADAFTDLGCKVIISDIDTEITNKELASNSDIIIISVPIRKTREVIREIVPFVKKGSLLTDLTSVKEMPVEEMTKAKDCEVVGGHPLFGPSVGLKNQNFIICKERTGEIYKEYISLLERLGIKIIYMSVAEHDMQMGVIQGLTHFSNITLGNTLQNIGYDIEKGESISSPVYLMRLYGVGRILDQDPELYSDIQIENKYARELAKKYVESSKQICDAVNAKDKESFEKIFNKSKDYFKKINKKSMKKTDDMIKAINN
ncbi:prephenate dehydrogenase/arogenate dehydrogenase family protein [Candidatus Woesearchaeota archaeon]|nr:MAG: prephenate dehydrogenase/arogenate dehydrogenase family protein [Candidatus Woesearchaeota archaeon]